MPSTHSTDVPCAGLVALVTGGGTGIGRAIAQQLADAGADVAVCGRRREPLEEVVEDLRQRGRRALAVTADVRRSSDSQRLVDEVVDHFGELDLLVNNAAIARSGPFAEITDEDVDDLIDIDLKGPILTTRAALPHLRLSSAAAILNISSNVTQMALKDYAVYSAAKAGIDMLTRCLALELAGERIRVNAILPGVVATPIFGTMMQADAAAAFLGSFGNEVPLGRIGQPEDIGRAAVHLCSPHSDWITGALLPVDGGLSLGPA